MRKAERDKLAAIQRILAKITRKEAIEFLYQAVLAAYNLE